jgi:hypothetical protein
LEHAYFPSYICIEQRHSDKQTNSLALRSKVKLVKNKFNCYTGILDLTDLAGRSAREESLPTGALCFNYIGQYELVAGPDSGVSVQNQFNNSKNFRYESKIQKARK